MQNVETFLSHFPVTTDLLLNQQLNENYAVLHKLQCIFYSIALAVPKVVGELEQHEKGIIEILCSSNSVATSMTFQSSGAV